MEQGEYFYHSPMGILSLWFEGGVLKRLSFGGEGRGRELTEGKVKRWIDGYFEGKVMPVDFGLEPEGTEFQKRVWREVQSVGWGSIISYGEIGDRMECNGGRAVGNAVGRNPIAIIIPCHRVIRSDGKIGGYEYGTNMKQMLLMHEGIRVGEGRVLSGI